MNGNGVILSTGATERNSKINIYDLAGNLTEWTLEKSNINEEPSTGCGGNYNSRGSNYPVYSFSEARVISNNYQIGFRIMLF